MMVRKGVSKRIHGILFAHLSPDEVRHMSAVKVITADTYDDDGLGPLCSSFVMALSQHHLVGA